MKIRTIIAIVALAFVPALSATAEPIKLKASEVAELGNGLAKLDGYERIIGQPDKTKAEEKTTVPYEFTGKVRFAIARNLVAVRAASQALDEAYKAIFQQVAGKDSTGIDGAKDPEKKARFDRLWEEASSQVVTLDLVRLTEADLNLEKNPIPGRVTLALAPVIVELAPGLAPPKDALASSPKK